MGIGHTNHCLCHGVRPFFAVELPGGQMLRDELVKLDEMVRSFESRFGHTPLAAALHRSGIAHFWVTYPGVAGTRSRPRPDSSQNGDGTTPRGRPVRPGSTGGAPGTTGR